MGDGQVRLRRRGEDRPRGTSHGARSEVQIGREKRRISGPEPPEDGPRVAPERGLEAAGQVGLVDLAALDFVANGLNPGLESGPIEP